MKDQFLSVEKLVVGYGKTPIVKNIQFGLNEGELCGIVGINGIGKSTLLRTLAQLQPKLQGEISIRQNKLTALSSQELAKSISVVLTDPIATRNLTVLELIALGRQPYTNWMGRLNANDITKINECLQLFQIDALKGKKCYELSDGQLQRVLIARAMAQDTPIIMLDEPTTHLDLYHKVHIIKLLKDLAHDFRKTILFTSHEIELAIQLCDKILILDSAENPFGTTAELIDKGSFTRLFPHEVVQFDPNSGTFKISK